MTENPEPVGTSTALTPPPPLDGQLESKTSAPSNDAIGTEDLQIFVAGTQIIRPSVAYKRACDAYSYRVSELIFGSLLASYILGFVAVGTNLGHITRSPLDMGWWTIITSPKLNFLVQAMSISVCFSYLTAAYYLTYHSSILTMPHFKTSNLRRDFTIAILQAVFFGVSVIRFELFPTMIAVSLLIVFFRQQIALRQLSAHFWGNIFGEGLKLEGNEGHRRRREFSDAIREINNNKYYDNCMGGWRPVSSLLWLGVTFLLAGGVAIIYYQWHSRLPVYCQTTSYVILTGLVFWLSSRVFLRSHEMPKTSKGLRIDEAAVELVEKVRAMYRR